MLAYRIMAWPLGKRKVGWVDIQDVALAVSAILVDPLLHKSKTYSITGNVLIFYYIVKS